MRSYSRSGFRFGGTCERILVLVFVPGEHPPKPPFWKTTLCQPPKDQRRAEYGFGEYGSNTEHSEFFSPHRVAGRKLSEVLSAFYLCVPKRTHRVFRRTHRVCCRTRWVLSSETVLSKQHSAKFPLGVGSLSGGRLSGLSERPCGVLSGRHSGHFSGRLSGSAVQSLAKTTRKG